MSNQLTFRFRGRIAKSIFKMRSWRPSRISDQNSLATFDLQFTLILPTKFRVSRPFGSGEEAQNRFSSWLPCRSSWNSDRNNLSFLSASCPDTFYQVSSQLVFDSEEEAQNRFSRLRPWRTSWIDRNDFSYFQSTILPIKFQVNWPSVHVRKTTQRCSRWSLGGLGFPIGTI